MGLTIPEAFRSFKRAAHQDTNCAMAYWGMALVLGPDILMHQWMMQKFQMLIRQFKKQLLFLMMKRKRKRIMYLLLKKIFEKKQDDRSGLDSAYADTMRKLSKKYPDDLHAATLFAESLMDLTPWDFWLKDGTPQQWTGEIIFVLENVLEKDSNQIGANKLYIDPVEASKNPGRGIPSAERLTHFVSGAGHLVHMPANIFIRVGKSHEGSLANEMAIKSDEEYLSQFFQQGFYPLAYYPHNFHFLWATATLEGDSKTALDAAESTSQKPPDSLLNVCSYKTLQHYSVIPFYAYVTFRRSDKTLEVTEPAKELLYPRGVWHYAKGMAFISKAQLNNAKLNLLSQILRNNKEIDNLTIWGINSAGQLLKIS